MAPDRVITQSELIENNGEDNNKLWVLIDGNVYDVTGFNHPGGQEILMEDQENDRFDEFESIHSPAAKRQLTKYHIGKIEGQEEGALLEKDEKVEEGAAVAKKEGGLNPIMLVGVVFLLIAMAVVYVKVLQK